MGRRKEMTKIDFDELIRQGEDIKAIRYFAKEYYDNGKMGHTRKLLIERVADELVRLKKENSLLKAEIWDLEKKSK